MHTAPKERMAEKVNIMFVEVHFQPLISKVCSYKAVIFVCMFSPLQCLYMTAINLATNNLKDSLVTPTSNKC